MRRLLLVICLAVISLAAGVALAGRPSSVSDDIVITARSPAPAITMPVTAPTLPPTTTRPVATTVAETTTTTTVRQAPATTSPAATSSTVGEPPQTAPATSLVPVGTTRVVVANATDTPGLARLYADQLGTMGYPEPAATDSALPVVGTTVYFADGFQPEATRLAEQLGQPDVIVEPRLPGPMAFGDPEADLWLILAADRAQ